MANDNKVNKLAFLPVMLTFFTMGFVDLVGAASNHVQADLHLTEAETYFIPSLVFFWFLIFSVPTSALMNRIGRKNTVLVSLVVTLLSLILPLFVRSVCEGDSLVYGSYYHDLGCCRGYSAL